MFRRVVGMGLAFGIGLFGVTVTAADSEKPADWSSWTPVGVWTGEVSRLSRKKGEGFTLKVTTTVPVPGRVGQMRTESKSFEMMFVDNSLIRWAKLPPKLNDKGKKVERTAEEIAELKKPTGVKGYAATREELKPGQLVEVILVRPKDLAAKDVQFSDYRVKWVTITGENPNAPEAPKPKEKPKK